jgi:hypothetical protein
MIALLCLSNRFSQRAFIDCSIGFNQSRYSSYPSDFPFAVEIYIGGNYDSNFVYKTVRFNSRSEYDAYDPTSVLDEFVSSFSSIYFLRKFPIISKAFDISYPVSFFNMYASNFTNRRFNIDSSVNYSLPCCECA